MAATTESFGLVIAGMAALGASSASTNSCRYVVTDLMVGPAQAVSTRLGLHPLAGPLLVDMTGALIAALAIYRASPPARWATPASKAPPTPP